MSEKPERVCSLCGRVVPHPEIVVVTSGKTFCAACYEPSGLSQVIFWEQIHRLRAAGVDVEALGLVRRVCISEFFPEIPAPKKPKFGDKLREFLRRIVRRDK